MLSSQHIFSAQLILFQLALSAGDGEQAERLLRTAMTCADVDAVHPVLLFAGYAAEAIIVSVPSARPLCPPVPRPADVDLAAYARSTGRCLGWFTELIATNFASVPASAEAEAECLATVRGTFDALQHLAEVTDWQCSGLRPPRVVLDVICGFFFAARAGDAGQARALATARVLAAGVRARPDQSLDRMGLILADRLQPVLRRSGSQADAATADALAAIISGSRVVGRSLVERKVVPAQDDD